MQLLNIKFIQHFYLTISIWLMSAALITFLFICKGTMLVYTIPPDTIIPYCKIDVAL